MLEHPQTIDQVMVRLAEVEASLARTQGDLARLRGAQRRRLTVHNAALAIAGVAVLSAFSRTKLGEVGQTVTAPFTVVDEAGQPMLRVKRSEDGTMNLLTMYENGTGVYQVSAMSSGGRVMVYAADGKGGVGLAANGQGNGEVAVFDNEGNRIADINRGSHGGQGLGVYSEGKLVGEFYGSQGFGVASAASLYARDEGRALVGRLGLAIDDIERGAQGDALPATSGGGGGPPPPPTGHDGLVIFGTNNSPIVQAYANAAQNGSVSAYSSTDPKTFAGIGVAQGGPDIALKVGGVVRAGFGVINGRASLDMSNASGAGIVVITEGAAGAGMFQLSNQSGAPTVEGGTLPDGHGIVRVGPQFQCGGTFAGLIQPDCIRGRAPHGESSP